MYTRAAALAHWLEHCDGADAPPSPAWDPHPLSVRILSWIKLLRAPAGGEGGGLELDAALDEHVRRSLADQIETLSHNLEVRLQANHLLDNLIAVVAGALALETPHRARWLRCADGLAAELDDQIDADGAHCPTRQSTGSR